MPELRVNGQAVDLASALPGLASLEEEARLVRELVDAARIREELERRGIEFGADALQDAMDAFRRSRGLYSAADTRAWLAQHGLTHARLEAHLAWQTGVDWLREELTEGAIGDRYHADPEAFDAARIVRISFALEAAAAGAAERVRGDGAGFMGMAVEEFAAGGAMPVFTEVRRRDLPVEVGHAIFDAAEGSVVGPLAGRSGWDLIFVLRVRRARLREPERTAIRETLFREWLARERVEATVEWT